MEIEFFFEDIEPFPFDKTITLEVINCILDDCTNKVLDYINIIFCTDNYLLKINQDYLSHDYYTDIITFDYDENKISSDIYISSERVGDNAISNNVTFLNELYRIIIHGILHLVGYKDKTDEQKKIMTEKENHYLEMIK